MNKYFARFKLFKIFKYLKKKRKIQLICLLLLNSLSALFEVVSLAAVIPFINTITNSYKDIENDVFQRIIFSLVGGNEDLVITATIIFSLTIVFASLIRIMCIWPV